MNKIFVLTIDLGGESGRVIKMDFDGVKFYLEEIHRFPNLPVEASGTTYWDVLSLWREIQSGIAKSNSVNSLGVDSWGVDFALLDCHGKLLSNPLHYRDKCSEGMMEWGFQRGSRKTLFARTGNQSILLNGLDRLAYLAKMKSPVLEACDTFLTIADLFNYWLTGNKSCEYTHVTTQQLYNPNKQDWDFETMETLGIPDKIFPEVLKPGTKIGNYQKIPVILPACHDTASAVVSVPSNTRDSAFLSSGTWSLLGIELDELILKDQTLEANLTNEVGYGVTNRFLQNIIVNRAIKVDDLLVGDKNAILTAARISGYGAEYATNTTCPACGTTDQYEFDLREGVVSGYHSDRYDADEWLGRITEAENDTFNIALPKSEVTVTVRMMTGHDETKLAKQLQNKKQQSVIGYDTNMTDQMRADIVAGNGSAQLTHIHGVINAMPASDSRFLRGAYQALMPNYDLKQHFACEPCGYEQDMEVPFTADFFWPKQ